MCGPWHGIGTPARKVGTAVRAIVKIAFVGNATVSQGPVPARADAIERLSTEADVSVRQPTTGIQMKAVVTPEGG